MGSERTDATTEGTSFSDQGSRVGSSLGDPLDKVALLSAANGELLAAADPSSATVSALSCWGTRLLEDLRFGNKAGGRNVCGDTVRTTGEPFAGE